jgi:hypothetical protein
MLPFLVHSTRKGVVSPQLCPMAPQLFTAGASYPELAEVSNASLLALQRSSLERCIPLRALGDFLACVPLTFQPLERVSFFPDTSHREERLWNDR